MKNCVAINDSGFLAIKTPSNTNGRERAWGGLPAPDRAMSFAYDGFIVYEGGPVECQDFITAAIESEKSSR